MLTNYITVKYLPLSDFVVVLGHEGRIVDQGPYESLKSSEFLDQTSQKRPIDDSTTTTTTTTSSSPNQDKSTKDTAKIPTTLDKFTIPGEPKTDVLKTSSDLAVYKYYFATVGFISSLVLFLTLAIFAFLYVFPSKYLSLPLPLSLL
jgi:ATP-binding cassette subfamily C (CFTR/MRP) protein 1